MDKKLIDLLYKLGIKKNDDGSFIRIKDNCTIYSPEDIDEYKFINIIQNGILDFCTCGEPKENLIFIKNILHKIFYKKLNSLNIKQCDLFVLYYLDEKGFTEHGSSIYYSWLNENGENLLNLLKIVLEELIQ